MLCKYSGDQNLIVIDVACIRAVVAMIPLLPPAIVDTADSDEKYYYLVERPGLDVTYLGGDHEIV